MAIANKVRLVEQLFDRLENEMNAFKSETNMHCRTSCGQCCSKPNINASPVEFLPWAFYLFLNGKSEEMLEMLNTKTTTNCHLYQSLSIIDHTQWSCSDYK